MKTDEKNLPSTATKTKKNGKKKEKFEVRIPRLIVRNLDFKVKEELLKKSFANNVSATIKAASIVTKDGQSKGFGFVTFETLDDAQKAVETMNGKKILGRPIAVDWSLPKNIYEKMHSTDVSESAKSDSYGFQSDPPVAKAEEEEEDEEEEEAEEPEEEEEKSVDPPAKPQTPSRDVQEHRTLFMRNVPFDATQEELAEFMSCNGQYRVRSCLLVVDPISRHPRGTAFVQFARREDAEECLKQSFKLRGQELEMDFALSREDLAKAKSLREEKKNEAKKSDQRNLSLANVGVILNLAELDGNEQDLRKRQQLEDMKRKKLKNPIYFISPTRLTIHNLPTNVDDGKLRQLILDALKRDGIPLKEVTMNECRVMKATKEAKKSLRYGFVNFTRHEHALKTIDLLNNNQHVFGPQRRPIVQFAVENRRALLLKEQRRDRVKAKEDLLKDPTKTQLSFDASTNKEKKKNRKNFFDVEKEKIRLSALIEEEADGDDPESQETEMEIDPNDQSTTLTSNSSMTKKKRRKSRSKGEIRDQLDQLIAKTRHKIPLPERKKKKWFE